MNSIVRLVSSMVEEVCRSIEKDKERYGELCAGLKFIKKEMEAVTGLMKDKDKVCRGAVQEIRIQQLQELAYDVEDFLESLRDPGQGAYGKLLVAIRMDPRPEQLRSIDRFKVTLSSITADLKQSAESNKGEADAMSDDEDEEAVEQLEAMDGPKSKIVELLKPSPGEGQQLRVISIVGCHGVGKTALARAVYHKYYSSSDEFDCVAWVTAASGCNNKKALLDKILHKVRADLASRAPHHTENDAPTEAQGGSTTKPNLHDILSDKRCLVFVDDVQQVQAWKDTVDACPKLGSKSRIVVTTSVLSVAKACSSGSYVYRMQYLSDDDSKRLFWRKVYGSQTEPPFSLVTDSEIIFSKCGGLPLALTSVAKHLNIKGETLDSTHCIEVGQNLGKEYLTGNDNVVVSVFKEMRRALVHYYDSLSEYDHRSCMLYLGIFPKGHQIKTKNLLRRLKAEGLVDNEGCKCFDALIDRYIVEPVQICNNSVVAKWCQVHSVVLEYIIQKSVAKNVVSLIQGHEPVLKGSTEACVRRLSIQSSSKERFDELDQDKKSALRSLTMFKTAPCDLRRCKMLRVLDLEGCNGLDQEFLESLCELLLLKYLNLRKTRINKIPPKIEKLQRLETLDIRETKVERLPMQVIMLPELAYLFGKFQLPEVPKGKEADKLYVFLKKKSVLHTLAGFVTNKRQSPEHVILLARKLKKIKVWCNDTPADDSELASSSSTTASERPSRRSNSWFPQRFGSKTHLLSQDHDCPWKKTEERRSNNTDFIKLLLKMRVTPLESVSIVSSSEVCNDFLGSLEGPCPISSIKLRGILNSLPDSNKLTELGRIKKLQLFSTGLTIKDLSALQVLRGLEYLKLVEYNDRFFNGVFIVEKKGFESLKSLCIDAPKVPKMQFKEGSMQSLTSLYLLCPNSQMPSGIIEGISHLSNLSEVILHSSMQQAWETVADGHPNRPCVKRQPPEPTGNTVA
ncbi:hypothetical protein HU200_056506 [Digitaria exilis]|uniref:Uncharacterized protein n=1 Tax=Digitaria exilis TaxID=1010633 RepID=A0A835AHC1_9POAL|nr:hypothetical protein HU200_056506 [Digitaria exilis]